jgi:hypothetical protein
MYTFNFAYVGSRATGNDAGKFLLAGPGWKGNTPPGIKAVIRSETEFAFVLYRTQLFDPADIDNVKRVQAGYKVKPLSQFLGTPPAAAPSVRRFREATEPGRRKNVAGVFQHAGLRPPVLPDEPCGNATHGSLRQARPWGAWHV